MRGDHFSYTVTRDVEQLATVSEKDDTYFTRQFSNMLIVRLDL